MRSGDVLVQDETMAQIGAEIEKLRAELHKAKARERDLEDTRKAVLNLLEDLEEDRQQIDRARQEWISAFDRVRDPMFMHDAEFRVFRANRAYAEAAGKEFGQIIGRPYWEVFPKAEGPLTTCQQTLLDAAPREQEITLPSGEVYRSRSFVVTDRQGKYVFSVHIMEDITEKHRAEMALRKLSAALSQAGEGIAVCDRDMVITYANSALCGLVGRAAEDLVGQPSTMLIAPQYSKAAEAIHKFLSSGAGWSGELEISGAGGLSTIPVRLNTSAIRDRADVVVGGVSVFTDLREIKQKELALRRLNRALETLSTANARLVRARDEVQLAQEVCDILAKIGGYRLAWIGYTEQDSGKTVRPIARAGHEQDYVDCLHATWTETDPTGRAIHTEQPVFSTDLQSDPDFAPWRDAALEQGYRSVIVLPMCVRGQCLGALYIHAEEPNAFDQDEIRLLVELADDLAFGLMAVRDRHNRIRAEQALRASEQRLRIIIDNEAEGVVVLDANKHILFVNPAAEVLLGRRRKALSGTVFAFSVADQKSVELDIVRPNGTRAIAEARVIKTEWFGKPAYIVSLQDVTERKGMEEERQRSAEMLQSRLVETIEAMGLAVEKRDPYTAGHQRRVASLVAAIGSELGFDKERIEGMRLGAAIHDIGKIVVPAEILNRPGQLNQIEHAIVLTHPEAGYDIVKGIEFPWPVAEMILQHHERLDGSGYPRGLKGDQINEEAKILAVADVVEAIASHRPYRPALGMKAALDEIISHRGVLYDPEAVDACVHILKSSGGDLSATA